MQAFLIKCTWMYASGGLLHTAYFFAWDPVDILEQLKKIRGMLYWKEPPKRIGDGMCGKSIVFTDYYVQEIEL